MKKKIWIIIISIVSVISLIITYNVLYNDGNGISNMKSYDINDYEIIEIHYDNEHELYFGTHTEETEGIRKQFDSYDGYVQSDSLIIDGRDLCYASNLWAGGYKKLEVDSDKIVTLSQGIISSDIDDNFGVYDDSEAFCNYEWYNKNSANDAGKNEVEMIKVFADKLMSEEKRVITNKSKLYEYTTILTGSEPEKMVLDVDGKEYKGYDKIITKIEFIDQGETRLVKIDSTIMVEDEQGNEVLNAQNYYKIILKKDKSEFEKEYNEIYDQVKDVPYEE